MGTSSRENKRNRNALTFQTNHAVIVQYILQYTKDNNRAPLPVEIHKGTGLHYNTVKKHLAKLDMSDQLKHMRVLTPNMIMATYQAGVRGNVQAQKLWYQLVEGWSEDAPLVPPDRVNQFDQLELEDKLKLRDIVQKMHNPLGIEDAEIVEGDE